MNLNQRFLDYIIKTVIVMINSFDSNCNRHKMAIIHNKNIQ